MADERLPPPWILTPPFGWLGFLGIKSGGKQPEHVAPNLDTSLEMFPFYQAGARQLLANANAIAAVQNGISLMATVPPNKLWIVESINVFSVALGAVAPSFIQVLAGEGGNGIYMGPVSAPGLTGIVLTARLDKLLILRPGANIQVYTSGAGAMTAFNLGATVQGVEVQN
jgi:hypothetical protein